MLKKGLSLLFGRKSPQLSAPDLLLAALKETRISSYAGFPLSQGVEIPCLRARRTLYPFYDKTHPVLSKFRSVIDEVSLGKEAILLDSVTGCAASKTSTSFAYMARLKWFVQKTENSKDNVEGLADKVLNGTDDCVKLRDKNATLYRQQWDGRQWFANYGGSHRTGAVWLIDKQNHHQRHVESDVKEFRIHEEFQEFCEDNSILLFKIECGAALMDVSSALKDADIILATDETFFTSRPVDCCLAVPKNNPFYPQIRQALVQSFDFSDWVLNPNDYMKYETHHIPAPESGLAP